MQYQLGLVLSGGGSRGLAHVGVLRALAEEGIFPDCIAGTSSGALIGALYAAGYPPPRMIDFFDEVNPLRLSRLALRKPGWIDSEKIHADLLRWFPDDSFEALEKRLFVTATDLVSGRLEIFASGGLVRPLLASSSIPFVFTPTRVDGQLYADGGILNNFPIEPLSGLCNQILGVYSSPLARVAQNALGSRLAVTQRALEIGMFHASKRKFHHADLVLCPDELSSYATFDVKRHAEIAEIGYREARERMSELRRLAGSQSST